MKRSIFLIGFILLIAGAGRAQQSYWQQELHYRLQAKLNDSSNSIDGYLQLQYINHSPDTLTYIWFHLWPNAYKNDRTAFSEQLLKN
ncbi:MAG TPA: M1 family peptidase, partial [Chitinophagaceae bacterium]|nr:M1 family peptidase [Chitinophagaceae bacterium]